MIYMSGSVVPTVRPHLDSGALGVLVSPRSGYRIAPGWVWAVDNGCFAKGYPGDEAYLAWLSERANTGGLWATAPDVVGDHTATLARSAPMLPRIRNTGWPVAFVAQDGATVDTMPWDDFDVLFLGGTTDWKLGADARALTAEAKRRGMLVHMGRVNSRMRYRYAEAIGCDSADGTIIAFGPDVHLPAVLGWPELTQPLWEETP